MEMKVGLGLRISAYRMKMKGYIIVIVILSLLGDVLTENQTRTFVTEGLNEEHEAGYNEKPNYPTETEDQQADSHDRSVSSRVGNSATEEFRSDKNSHPNLEQMDTGFSKDNPENESLETFDQTKDSQNINVTETKFESGYKENLSLREILKELMPLHLSSSGDLGSEKDDKLTSGVTPATEDLDKDENLASNSGFSEIPLNTRATNSSENASSLNITESNTTKTSNNSQSKKAVCLETEKAEKIVDVEILNATALQKVLQNNPNITSRSTQAKCCLVYFYSPYCPFSTQGSAYVNALARSIPNIPVFGLDSIEYHSLNARYGIMGTPSLVLFHNGNVAGRYNASEFSTFYLEAFVNHFTDQKISSINVTSNDFKSNLPSQTLNSPPYALYFAWAFLLTCGASLFLDSEFYAKLTEAVLNNWREAEAQHEHDD